MNFINVLLIIGGITAAVGLLCFAHEKLSHHNHHGSEPADSKGNETPGEDKKGDKESGEVCCGLHAVCEKMYGADGKERPLYYDDEELDVLSGRSPESFTDSEREMIRDVMLTLLPEDRPGWAKSIEMRNIELPSDLRDELLMLLTE